MKRKLTEWEKNLQAIYWIRDSYSKNKELIKVNNRKQKQSN